MKNMIFFPLIKKTDFWLKWCVFNFLIVAIIGVLMRYNILFSLPIFQHKFMQQSHSHFAFYGWVSACIYALIYYYLKEQKKEIFYFKYQIAMLINQVGAFGMLISFLYGGYYWLSIIFSSLSFFVGVAYFFFIVKDTKGLLNPAFIWLKIGGFFATFSAIGIFGLSYFNSKKEDYEILFRASTYFYLHFQYNGFFLFSCVGLFLLYLQKQNIFIPEKLNKKIISFLFFGTLFGYGLSILWIQTIKETLLFWIFVALIQIYGAFLLLKFVFKHKNLLCKQIFIQRLLIVIFTLVFVFKFFLQFLSTFPVFTQYAFYNINFIMAYLHLILLVGISLFLVWKILNIYNLKTSLILNFSIYLLVFGVLFNEVLLAILASTSFFNFVFYQAFFWLFISSLIIMISVSLIFYSLKSKRSN